MWPELRARPVSACWLCCMAAATAGAGAQASLVLLGQVPLPDSAPLHFGRRKVVEFKAGGALGRTGARMSFGVRGGAGWVEGLRYSKGAKQGEASERTAHTHACAPACTLAWHTSPSSCTHKAPMHSRARRWQRLQTLDACVHACAK